MAIVANSIMQLSFRADCFGQRIRHVRNFSLQSGGTGPSSALDFQEAFMTAVQVGGGVVARHALAGVPQFGSGDEGDPGTNHLPDPAGLLFPCRPRWPSGLSCCYWRTYVRRCYRSQFRPRRPTAGGDVQDRSDRDYRRFGRPDRSRPEPVPPHLLCQLFDCHRYGRCDGRKLVPVHLPSGPEDGVRGVGQHRGSIPSGLRTGQDHEDASARRVIGVTTWQKPG